MRGNWLPCRLSSGPQSTLPRDPNWETASAPPYLVLDNEGEHNSAEAPEPDDQTDPAYEGSPVETSRTYHIQTRLSDGWPALMVDPGSVGNLCGDAWARGVAAVAHHNGHQPKYTKPSRPLRVQGVGNGAQVCAYDCTLPIALR